MSTPKHSALASYDEIIRAIDTAIAATMKRQGFTKTLKDLNRGHLPTPEMMSVRDGVIEKLPSGEIEAALDTDKGPLVFTGIEQTKRKSADPQSACSIASHTEVPTGECLLRELQHGATPSRRLICAAEFVRFDPTQRQVLIPLLWQFILDYRDSNNRDELVAVGAAIRKYIAVIPIERMGELAVLLESGHKSPLPIELEIEVAKMIYRNFEVHPPITADPHPELAQRLWEMVQAYINPRILLRDKHSAVTSLAIEAIVSMRSKLAEQTIQAAIECPYRWFAELVSDDLDDLLKVWTSKNSDAASWLGELLSIFPNVMRQSTGGSSG